MSEGRPQSTAPGYRGALPPRGDLMARAWVVLVIVIFFAIFVLAALGVPSRLFPEPTPLPTPTFTTVPSESPGGTPGPTGSPVPSASESIAESTTPSPAP